MDKSGFFDNFIKVVEKMAFVLSFVLNAGLLKEINLTDNINCFFLRSLPKNLLLIN